MLVGCGSGDEQHELGALLLTLLLRARGHRVVYLRPFPAWPWSWAAAALDPAGVVVSLTMPESLELALGWTSDHRRWSRHTLQHGGAARRRQRPRPGHPPARRLLDGGVDAGAATVDAALARRR